MPWDFTASEAADAIAVQRYREFDSLAGKPRWQCEVLATWRQDLALLAERADGLLQDQTPVAPVSPPPASPRPAPQLSANLQACARNVHTWSPPDDRGWAKCFACGTVSITGGSAANGGTSGAYDLGDEVARSTVQLG